LVGPDFGLAAGVVERIMDFVGFRSSGHDEAIARLAALRAEGEAAGNESLLAGAAELAEVLELLRAQGLPESDYAVNFSIARGLDYYTGTVYETTLDD